jgi:hypothetical protein
LELPDDLFREVKSTAAKQGILMKQFIAEALREKLSSAASAPSSKPWMQFAGCLAKDPALKAELARVSQIIEDEFGRVDEADWK